MSGGNKCMNTTQGTVTVFLKKRLDINSTKEGRWVLTYRPDKDHDVHIHVSMNIQSLCIVVCPRGFGTLNIRSTLA
jgi:hypothetical protein